MKILAKPSFSRDLKKISKPTEIYKIYEAIIIAENLDTIPNIKKMAGYKNAYRIRVGDFRIGFFYENETIVFARVLNRKDIYKFFP